MSNFDFLGSFLGKKAKLTKDGHDLSNLEAASFPFGVNVPVTYYPVVPNEHYRVKMSGMLQTAPMREDNFAQIYSNQKAVFVPISSFWRDYLSTTQVDKDTRKDTLLSFPNYAPVFNLRDVLNLVFPNFMISRLFQALVSVVPNYYDYFYKTSENSFMTRDGLNITDILRDFTGSPDFAHQCALGLYRIFTSQASSIVNDYPLADFVNNVQLNVSPAGTPIYMDTLRILDALGYGNFYPAFESFFSYIVNGFDPDVEIDNYFKVSSGYLELTPQFFVDFINPEGHFYFANTLNLDKVVSALPLLAYQYYVSLVERSNYRKPDITVLSYDAILKAVQSDTLPYGRVFNNSFCFIFGFDYFSPDYADPNRVADFCEVVNLLITYSRGMMDFYYQDSPLPDEYTAADMFSYLFSLNNPKLPSDLYTTMSDSVVQGNVPYTDISDIQTNIVSAYANSSALYSLRQDLLRAGVRRDKQMQAIFGVSGNQHVFEPIKVLDDTSSQVQIQGLLNQAETSEAALGARAARGNGKYGLQFNFDSEEFGFIFIVQNFTCSVFYENFMIDRAHLLSPDAWFNPKFNHLGLEQVKGSYISVANGEVYSPALRDVSENPFRYNENDTVFGYSARNYELKQRVNRVHGAFTNFPLPNMPIVGTDPLYASSDLIRGNSPFGGFVPTVLSQQTERFDFRQSLYYSPNMVNNLFVNMVAGGLYGDYATDFFRCAYTLSVHKVSPMPKLGLFKLDV